MGTIYETSAGLPTIALWEEGSTAVNKGKVLFLGDTKIFSNPYIGRGENAQFVQQVIDWAQNVKATFGDTASTEITKTGDVRKNPQNNFAFTKTGPARRVYCDLDLHVPTNSGSMVTHTLRSVRIDPYGSGTDGALYTDGTTLADPLSFTIDTVQNTANNMDSTYWFSFNLIPSYFQIPAFEYAHFVVTAELALTINGKKRVTFDDVEVELEDMVEFQDPFHPMYAPRKAFGDDSEHSPVVGISLLQAEDNTFGTAELEIQGNGEYGSEGADDEDVDGVGIEEATQNNDITESAMQVEVLVGILGAFVLAIGACILVCVAVRRRKKAEEKKVLPITIETVQTHPNDVAWMTTA